MNDTREDVERIVHELFLEGSYANKAGYRVSGDVCNRTAWLIRRLSNRVENIVAERNSLKALNVELATTLRQLTESIELKLGHPESMEAGPALWMAILGARSTLAKAKEQE